MVRLADLKTAQDLLGQVDEFIQITSDFERALRLHSVASVSREDFAAFCAACALEWTIDEVEKIKNVLKSAAEKFKPYTLGLPPEIWLVKTSGLEEGGAAYTRGQTIVLSTQRLARTEASLERLLIHEVFHVLSRSRPALRDALYREIGFEPCGFIALPEELERLRITNPDTPLNQHSLLVTYQRAKLDVLPVLFASQAEINPTSTEPHFSQVKFAFLALEDGQAVYQDNKPLLLNPEALSGLYEQVGRNTGPIIQAEEVVAENFMFLLTGQTDLPDPCVPERIGRVLGA
jgi:hypothetical protein